MERDKIALQVYSVRDDMQADFYGTLKKVKEFGYSGVEFAGLYGQDPLEVKAMCEELGLVPISAHVPLLEFMEDLEGTVECYKKLGVSYIVVPYLLPEYRPGTENFQVVIDTIKKIGPVAKEAGLVLQYHNHDFEFVKLEGEYALDILYREVGPELLQTQLDTCWVNVGGENPVAYIEKYAGRIPTIHLKDFAGSKSENMYALIGVDEKEKKEVKGTFEFRPLGKGVQDFPAIIEAATKHGSEWFIVEQDNPSMGYTALESAKISAEYLLNTILA